MEEKYAKTIDSASGPESERLEGVLGTEAEAERHERTEPETEALQVMEPPTETTETAVPEAMVEKEAPVPESVETLRQLLQEKEEQVRQEHERWMRAYAEYENYKKRVARDKAAQERFAHEALLRALLPVIDNLERCVCHAEQTPHQDAIATGVEMVRRELLRILEMFGLKVITSLGRAFDPTLHEAVAQRESGECPENTVVEEVQRGYCLYERLLRPARVVVAKAPQAQES